MTVNRTTLLDLPLPVTGTESGTWGDTTNNGLTQYLDIAIAGTLVLSTDADVTLTSTEGDSSATNIGATTAQYAILRWTATGSTTRNITALAQSKTYVVINATGGTQSIVLRGAGPTTGVTIISGEKAFCVWNGSDFVKVSSSAAAGGSNTQVQYNSSGVLAGVSGATTNGTAITFSTTNLKLQGSSTGVSSFASANSSATDYTVTFPAASTTIPIATQTLTFSGPTAARTITLPDANFTAARTDAAQTFTGTQTFSSDPVLSGGTANGVLYLNASKVATSGSALTFDGTNLVNLGGVVRALAAATQDALQLQGRAGGTSSYITTLTPGTLTASNTLTLPVGTTTLAGLGTTQTFSAAQTFSSTVTMSGTTTNIALGTSQTSGTWTAGGAAQTGTITLDQSSKTHTLAIGTGATESGLTKTINIGTGGVATSTTAITIGSTNGTTITLNGTVNATTANLTTLDLTNLEVTNIKAKDGTAAASIADSTGVISITSNPVLSGGTANGVLYLNGSKVATSGSALTFDGTNFSTTGTATATKLVPTGNVTAGNGMYLPATNTLAWSNNGAETMRLDSSGNLGLGVTPSAWGTYKALQVGGAGYGLMGGTSGTVFGSLVTNAYYDGTNWKYVNNAYAQRYDTASGEHRWYTAPSGTAGNTITFTQAMTLDTSENLLVGGTAQPVNNATARLGVLQSIADYIQVLRNSNASPYGIYIKYDTDTNNSTNSFIAAVGNATTRFLVTSNGNVTNTNNSYGGISDVKLKENIADATPKLNDLLQVRVVNYNLKSQPDQKHIGVIAQELEQVFPGLIEESQDRDTDGELTGETIKSVKYSVFVPMLIKAMQEQQALITALTARVALLEGN